MRKLIETRVDIELLIREFYNKLLPDPTVGYIFTEVAQLDLDTHLPILCDFWEIILLGTGNYKGNVMMAHIALDKKTPLLPEHFARWKFLFFETIDTYFEGAVADEAKRRVELMEGLMQFKIAQSREKGFIQ